MTNEVLKSLIASNAKVIEALLNSITRKTEDPQVDQDDRSKEQAERYQLSAEMAMEVSSLYAVQAGYYHQLAELSHP